MREIDLELQGPLAILTLDRPAKLNAITPDMLKSIEAAVAEVENAPQTRALIVRGHGRVFSVGADINVWSELTTEEFRTQWVLGGHRAFDRLARCRIPVIASLHGMALGGGLELALAADLRIAEESTQMGLPEVSLGTVPGWGGTQRLPELIGVPRAKEMLFTGERLNAHKAERWGLVNVVAAPGAGFEAAQAMARRICEMAPISVQVAKSLVDGHNGHGLAATLETLAGVATATTSDVKEGIAALKAKRPPKFEGR